MGFYRRSNQPRLAVIDASSDKIGRWIELPGIAYGTAPTPDGKWLLIALIGLNKIGAVDLQEMKLSKTLDVPKAPQEIVVQPDGAKAYAACDASHQVAVIDLREWKVEKLVDAGAGADGLAWAAR